MREKNFHPLDIGSVSLPSNILYAPLAGCSDWPFRKMCRLFHKGLLFTEMVKMEALIRLDRGTFRLLDFSPDMHPIGAQICGSNPKIAGQSAQIIENLGFDTIDLNCGCPVDKVTKDGSGSGLLKSPEKIGMILHEMVTAVKIPVTVKIRAGWDETMINAPKITQMAEMAGAKAITIHGRTRQQGYKGKADREVIKECKQRARAIKVIGNGDIFSPEDANQMFLETGVDGVLVARGTLGNPAIAEEIRRFLQKEIPLKKDGAFYKKILEKHTHFIETYQNPQKALIDLRRVGCWYLKSAKGAKELRQSINKAPSIKEAKEIIARFSFEELDWS